MNISLQATMPFLRHRLPWGGWLPPPLGNFLIFQDMFKCNIPLDSAFNSVQNGVLFGKICGRVPVKKNSITWGVSKNVIFSSFSVTTKEYSIQFKLFSLALTPAWQQQNSGWGIKLFVNINILKSTKNMHSRILFVLSENLVRNAFGCLHH